MKQNNAHVIVGLEIGTSKVVAAVAEVRDDGSMMLLGVGQAPSSGIRKGEVVDFQDAQACVRQAIADAEGETDVEIGELYLILTGAHISSRTDMVRCTVLEDDQRVTQDAVDELKHLAQNLVIPRDCVIVHSLLQHYRLDNGDISREPIGLNSQNLEAYFHLIYGLQTRLQTTVRCVAEQNIEVSGYALGSYAMSQAVLTSEAKQHGALAIDIGAGVTDYIVYNKNAVIHTGVLSLGGDHMTQDLAIGLRLPYQKAEQLKRDHGNLFMEGHHPDEKITLERDMSFEERQVYCDSVTKILHSRQREMLELIYEDIESRGLWSQISNGVYITGGASQMQGLDRLAQEIFPVEVHMVHEHQFFDGDQTYSKRPDLSTVFGLLRYAQKREMKKIQSRGWRRLRNSVVGLLHSMKLF
jgi:cell division protein FtsA